VGKKTARPSEKTVAWEKKGSLGSRKKGLRAGKKKKDRHREAAKLVGKKKSLPVKGEGGRKQGSRESK